MTLWIRKVCFTDVLMSLFVLNPQTICICEINNCHRFQNVLHWLLSKRVGVPASKSEHSLQLALIFTLPLYPGFHIHRFNHCRRCSTVAFTIKKKSVYRWSIQFKPVLFRGQLCFYKNISILYYENNHILRFKLSTSYFKSLQVHTSSLSTLELLQFSHNLLPHW